LFWNNHARKVFEEDFNIRVRLAIEELGPTFIKLGQLLSNRPDIIPKDLQEELVKLQDEVADEGIDIRKRLSNELEIDLDARVISIVEKPIARDSIAQVYRATLSNGREGGLKVKREEFGEVIEADLDFLKDLVKYCSGNMKWFIKGTSIRLFFLLRVHC